MNQESSQVACSTIISEGGIAVIPTDTVYGIVCLALNQVAVERLYTTRSRSLDKPCIILISKISDIRLFDIDTSPEINILLEKIWPSKVSVILEGSSPEFQYLHRGKNSLAFRIPNNPLLRDILERTGPLLAPSANPEGKTTAQSIQDAQLYFGDSVDYYLEYPEGQTPSSSPSTLISVDGNGKVIILRPGAVSKKELLFLTSLSN